MMWKFEFAWGLYISKAQRLFSDNWSTANGHVTPSNFPPFWLLDTGILLNECSFGRRFSSLCIERNQRIHCAKEKWKVKGERREFFLLCATMQGSKRWSCCTFAQQLRAFLHTQFEWTRSYIRWWEKPQDYRAIFSLFLFIYFFFSSSLFSLLFFFILRGNCRCMVTLSWEILEQICIFIFFFFSLLFGSWKLETPHWLPSELVFTCIRLMGMQIKDCDFARFHANGQRISIIRSNLFRYYFS